MTLRGFAATAIRLRLALSFGVAGTLLSVAGKRGILLIFHDYSFFGVNLIYPVGVFSLFDIYTPYGYKSNMQPEAKAAVLKRLNRIEGQVRGLSRMVEEDRYCIDVVTQISAVRAALRRAEEEILRDHVSHCVEHAIASGDKKDQRKKISEIIDVLGRSDR